MRKEIEIVCGGIVVADVMMRPVDRLPRRGTLLYVSGLELHLGGCAANTAVALARLGAGVALVTRIGKDDFGRFLESALEREGIDCSLVRETIRAGTSATGVAVSSDGERSFIHNVGSNAELRASDFSIESFPRARHLHLGGALLNPRLEGRPLGAIMKKAKAAGLTTSLDTVWSPRKNSLGFHEQALPHTDILFANEREGKLLTGRRTPGTMAKFLLERGVGTVVIKQGERGGTVFTAHGEFSTPALRAKCVDTTGAGDAFVGGFLYSFLCGGSLEEAARLGSAAGALCVTKLGAIAGLGNLSETKRFMARAKTLK
ncbi:MAG: carbohydrate kinase family protein [bacterium]